MPAQFFVDENDLALGKALDQQHGNVVYPGHPGLWVELTTLATTRAEGPWMYAVTTHRVHEIPLG